MGVTFRIWKARFQGLRAAGGSTDTDYVTQRRPPQQLRAKLTRQHLLDAARRAFAEGGYGGATVDDVARAAGCSKGAYYFHFATKEEALLALVEDWTAAQTERLQQAAGSGGSAERALAGLIEALLTSEGMTARERLLALEFWLQGARNPKVRTVVSRAQRSWKRLLVPALARAQEAGVLPAGVAPDEAADLALALHHGLLVQACLDTTNGAVLRERAAAAIALLAGSKALRRAG